MTLILPQIDDPSRFTYSVNASQFFARITNPGTTRKNAYAAIIDGLAYAGIWSKLDALYILAADIQANAYVNLISSSFTCTSVNTPTFTANTGIVGALNTTYVASAYNFSTGTNFQQNSAHIATWSPSGSISTFTSIAAANTGNLGTNLFPYYTGGLMYGRCNDNVELGSFSAASAVGLSVANRSGANNREVYRNTALAGSSTSSASKAVLNDTVAMCRGSIPVSLVSIGGSLSSTDVTNYYNTINANKWW